MYIRKIHILLLTSLFTFSFIGYSQPSVENERYCANVKYLIGANDTLINIEIDYSLDEKDIMDSIQSIIGKDICWKEVRFNLYSENLEKTPVSLIWQCPNIIFCTYSYRKMEIELNSNGELLVEVGYTESSIPIDSLDQWLKIEIPKKNDIGDDFVSIKWQKETPSGSIEETFDKIRNGYLMSYTHLSKKLFSKNICDLNKNELYSLKIELPFKILLGMGKYMRPPPPPPPPKEILNTK